MITANPEISDALWTHEALEMTYFNFDVLTYTTNNEDIW